MPKQTGTKQTKRTVGASRASLGGGSGKGSGALGKSSGLAGDPPESGVKDLTRGKHTKPHKDISDRDDTNDPPTPKIRYSKGGDSAARQLKMSLNELKKLSTYLSPPEKTRKRITVESIIAENKKEREDAEKRVRAQKINVLEKALDEIKKLQISGGLGSRGLGSEHGYTQGQQESTQVTLVQPRPEDDRVQSKRTTKEPKKQQL